MSIMYWWLISQKRSMTTQLSNMFQMTKAELLYRRFCSS